MSIEATLSPHAAETERAVYEGLGPIIQRLDTLLRESFSPGDLADLRRMQPGRPGCPAFWRLAAAVLEPQGHLPPGDGLARERAESHWGTILAGMAHGKDLHRKGRPLGRALAESGVSELRLLRLLRATDQALLDLVRVTVHQVASEGVTFDWVEMADLILSDGATREDSVRRRIARAYYRQLTATTA